MNQAKRLFFAINLPEEIKREISEAFFEMLPKDKWRKVKEENLHVTMRFLGHIPKEKINELRKEIECLEEFAGFDAELSGVGHFNNKVLWVGVEKGIDGINLLSKKLCTAIGVTEERFHAHVTLARNRGSSAKETDELIERMRAKKFSAKIAVKGIELMESVLHEPGPEYSVVFSTEFKEPQ